MRSTLYGYDHPGIGFGCRCRWGLGGVAASSRLSVKYQAALLVNGHVGGGSKYVLFSILA